MVYYGFFYNKYILVAKRNSAVNSSRYLLLFYEHFYTKAHEPYNISIATNYILLYFSVWIRIRPDPKKVDTLHL